MRGCGGKKKKQWRNTSPCMLSHIFLDNNTMKCCIFHSFSHSLHRSRTFQVTNGFTSSAVGRQSELNVSDRLVHTHKTKYSFVISKLLWITFALLQCDQHLDNFINNQMSADEQITNVIIRCSPKHSCVSLVKAETLGVQMLFGLIFWIFTFKGYKCWEIIKW